MVQTVLLTLTGSRSAEACFLLTHTSYRRCIIRSEHFWLTCQESSYCIFILRVIIVFILNIACFWDFLTMRVANEEMRICSGSNLKLAASWVMVCLVHDIITSFASFDCDFDRYAGSFITFQCFDHHDSIRLVLYIWNKDPILCDRHNVECGCVIVASSSSSSSSPSSSPPSSSPLVLISFLLVTRKAC